MVKQLQEKNDKLENVRLDSRTKCTRPSTAGKPIVAHNEFIKMPKAQSAAGDEADNKEQSTLGDTDEVNPELAAKGNDRRER